MAEQFKAWEKSANQLEAIKKKTGTLQQIQQGIESSQVTLNETRDQVETLVKTAKDLQAQRPQSSVMEQRTADINAANARTVADWVKFQKDFQDFKKDYALDVKESKDMIRRLDETMSEMEHSAQMVKGKGAASLTVSRATKATLNSMLDDKLKRFTKDYIGDCALKRLEPILQRDLDLLETKIAGEITRLDRKTLGPTGIQTYPAMEERYTRLLQRLEVMEKADLINRMGTLEHSTSQHFQELPKHGFEDGSDHPLVTRLRMLEGWKLKLETTGVKIDLTPVEERLRQMEEFRIALEEAGLTGNLESRIQQLEEFRTSILDGDDGDDAIDRLDARLSTVEEWRTQLKEDEDLDTKIQRMIDTQFTGAGAPSGDIPDEKEEIYLGFEKANGKRSWCEFSDHSNRTRLTKNGWNIEWSTKSLQQILQWVNDAGKTRQPTDAAPEAIPSHIHLQDNPAQPITDANS
jgi:DNA repair exonuclease SbcCD ATPase subunit